MTLRFKLLYFLNSGISRHNSLEGTEEVTTTAATTNHQPLPVPSTGTGNQSASPRHRNELNRHPEKHKGSTIMCLYMKVTEKLSSYK